MKNAKVQHEIEKKQVQMQSMWLIHVSTVYEL